MSTKLIAEKEIEAIKKFLHDISGCVPREEEGLTQRWLHFGPRERSFTTGVMLSMPIKRARHFLYTSLLERVTESLRSGYFLEWKKFQQSPITNKQS